MSILRQIHSAIMIVTGNTGWRRPFLILGWWGATLPRVPKIIWRDFWWGDEGNTNYPGS